MSREKLEWTHYESWEGNKKVLVIGDSIVWGSHSFIETLLPEDLALTTVVSAHGVNEEQFFKSVSTLATLNDSFYEAVYFNNGLHPRGQSAEEYAKNYENVVTELIKVIPARKWLLGLSTPISSMQTDVWDNSTPITDKTINSLRERNDLVIEYNKKVKEIAHKLNLPFYDAYELVKDLNDLKIDPYHYNEDGRKIIAEGICGAILKVIQ